MATEATGKSVTVDGVTYELLGYDAKGLPVYQDAEVLRARYAAQRIKVAMLASGKHSRF